MRTRQFRKAGKLRRSREKVEINSEMPTGANSPPLYQEYRDAALRGQNLLDNETERGIRTWTSATEIARLLLVGRIPILIHREHDLWRFRVLGAIIPDLHHVIGKQQENRKRRAEAVRGIAIVCPTASK
ncbi:hypothetical protein ACWGS9_30840 [Bradyrhizobium sp. Arg314]